MSLTDTLLHTSCTQKSVYFNHIKPLKARLFVFAKQMNKSVKLIWDYIACFIER